MVGHIGKAADPRIVEAGNKRELRWRAAAGGEDFAQHLRRGIVIDEAVASGESSEEIVLEATDRRPEIGAQIAVPAPGRDRVPPAAPRGPPERRPHPVPPGVAPLLPLVVEG